MPASMCFSISTSKVPATSETSEGKHLTCKTVSVFVLPKSLEQLKQRLHGRDSDSDAVIQERLRNAEAEIARKSEFDYVIPSDSKAKDLAHLRMVYMAEKLSRK